MSAIALIAAARLLVFGAGAEAFFILEARVMGPCVRRDDPLERDSNPFLSLRGATDRFAEFIIGRVRANGGSQRRFWLFEN